MTSGKIADRPHLWTLLFSAVASALSVLSLVQSCRAVRMTEASSRAALQVTSVAFPRDPKEMPHLEIDLTLTNFGNATATNVETSFEWEVTPIAVPISKPNYTQPQLADFARNSTRVVRLHANRIFSGGSGRTGEAGLKDPKNQLLVHGFTTYTDELTRKRFRDNWCFEYDPRDATQVASRVMRPCVYQAR